MKKRVVFITVIILLFLMMTPLFACAKIESISLNVDNAKTLFLSDEAFNYDGLEVIAHFSDGTSKHVSLNECEVVKPVFAPYGEKQVLVEYKDLSAEYSIYIALNNSNNEDKSVRSYTLKQSVVMTAYLVGDNKPFVLILPGGGYNNVAETVEGTPYAQKINSLGYNAFVLRYSVKSLHPAPLNDVASCIKMIFANADIFGVSADNYAVCGSSAGGHLAATWCTKNVGYAHYGLPKPSTAILCYSVISINGKSNSKMNLLGEDCTDEEINALSVDKHVDGDYPATFLWAFNNDNNVDIAQTQLMDEILSENGVEHICCIYNGEAIIGSTHGLGLALGTVAEGWMEEAISFWQSQVSK